MGVFDFQSASQMRDEPDQHVIKTYENNGSTTMTVPQSIRDALGIDSGDQVVVKQEQNGFSVRVIEFEQPE